MTENNVVGQIFGLIPEPDQQIGHYTLDVAKESRGIRRNVMCFIQRNRSENQIYHDD